MVRWVRSGTGGWSLSRGRLKASLVLVLEGGGELGARADAELAVCVTEVRLDGLLGDEQSLGDLRVGQALGGHRRDAPLAGRQRLGAQQARTARAPPRRAQFLA